MDKLIKKNIRILSERFNHTIEYTTKDILINSKINSIKLCPRNKYGFEINYNSDKEIVQIITNIRTATAVVGGSAASIMSATAGTTGAVGGGMAAGAIISAMNVVHGF